MRLLHVITSLETGGSNMMLVKLLQQQADPAQAGPFEPEVAVFMPGGGLVAAVQAVGVRLHTLDIAQGDYSPAALLKLRRLIQTRQPAIVHAWTYQSNLAATLSLTFLRRQPPLIWYIGHTPAQNFKPYRRMTRLSMLVSRYLSWQPAAIVYNSNISASRHAALGFADSRAVIIHNGFDLERFQPNPACRSTLRRMLNLPEETPLIGHIARYHPMKDHAGLLRAAALLHQIQPQVHFVLIGREVSPSNPALWQQIQAAGLEQHIHLLDERHDLPAIYPGLDILTLNSAWGEGLPNVLGEAMSCGVLCVATDIGDSAAVLGGHGQLIPASAPQALVQAWQRLLSLSPAERQQTGLAARRHIGENFSLANAARRYQALYQTALHPG